MVNELKVQDEPSSPRLFGLETRCPVCFSVQNTPASFGYINQHFKHLRDENNPLQKSRLLLCDQCGFGWVFPAIDRNWLETLYASNYMPYAYGHEPKPIYHQASPLSPRFTAHLLLARLFRDFKEGDSVLDIGAWWGTSFHTLSRLVPGIRCFAFEPDVKCRQVLEDVHGAYVYPYLFPAETRSAPEIADGRQFDLILMSHALEHYNGADVLPALNNVSKILTSNGLFVCEVPHCDLRLHASMRVNDCPHLSFFSKDGLQRAIERAGLKVRFIDSCCDEYETWWPSAKVAENEWRTGWDRRLARWVKQLPLPKRFVAAALTLKMPDQVTYLLQSNNFSYGGDRTCLRVVASLP